MQPQIQTAAPDGAESRQLSAVGAGRAPKASGRRKPRGPRAASNRALLLRSGDSKRGIQGLGKLPAHKEALLGITARLWVHLENASDRLFREGELTAEGDVRQLVPRVIDLARLIRENLVYLSDGAVDGADPFGPMLGGNR